MFTRRKFLGASTALGGLSLAPGLAREAHAQTAAERDLYEAASREGRVVMYVSAPLDSSRDMLRDFEARYPRVKVEIQRLVSTQQYQRFLSESDAGQNIADVLQLSDKPAVEDLVARRLVARYTSPDDSRFQAPGFKMPGYAYVPWSTDVVIMYNTKVISEADGKKLRSWRGILDPAFKNKIAMRAKLDGAGYAPFLYLLDEKANEYGEDYMKALAAQEPVILADPVQAANQVLIGEKGVWFPGWESLALAYFLKGGPVRWVFPEPAPAYGNVWTFISAKSQRPNAARLLMNWWTSEAAARTIETKYLARAAMTGRQDSRAVAREKWYQSITNPWIPDAARWDANKARIGDMWKRHFGKYGAQ